MSKCRYFAYGSNLLAKRIHLLNPSAVRYDIGVLKDYILEFGSYGPFWDGSPANIKKKPGEYVWGAIWELKMEDISNLDYQEGVHENFYYPHNVEIETPDGKKVECRVYQLVEKLEEMDIRNLDENRRPSKAYLGTIIKGAEESGLPDEYIRFLESIPTNSSNYVPDFLKS